MNNSVEAKIIEFHLCRYMQDKMTVALHTSKARVSRSVRDFHETGFVPGPLRVGRPSKITNKFASDIEAKTISEPSISGEPISGEISGEFGVSLLLTAVNVIQVGQRFKDELTQHEEHHPAKNCWHQVVTRRLNNFRRDIDSLSPILLRSRRSSPVCEISGMMK
jgi:hypothetical protein